MSSIDYRVQDGVAELVINRPEARNAFTVDMVDEWADLLDRADADDQVGALLLTGAPGAFCAGGDLSDIEGIGSSPWVAKRVLSEHIHRVALTMDRLDKPTLAAINGVAVGAGLDMALMCDIRYMSDQARVSEGYIRLGLVPGDGGAYYLPRIVGEAKALEMLLTGDWVDAEEALRIGLVSRVCSADTLLDEARALARRLAAAAPLPARMIKRAVRLAARQDLRTSLDLISSHMGLVAVSDDAQEAIRAFSEGRAPQFTGR